jgi:hypothetical protein
MFVPVINSENKPLMPTTPGRAKRMLEGIFSPITPS